MTWKYRPKEVQQLRNWINDKRRKGISEFDDAKDFLAWYADHEKTCHYCGLTEEESQQIIHNGVLQSKRFPLDGELRRGVSRGYWLEIDKRNPRGKYSRKNCVLSCYFCNNDKSDVFTDTEYKEFIQNRIGFLKKKLNS